MGNFKPLDDKLDDLREGRTTELDIDDVNWPDEAEEIIHALKHAPKVTHIKARWMKPEYIPALTEALQKLPELIQLDLSNSKFQPEDIRVLLPALKNMPRLESLMLDNINIGDEIMEELSEVIRESLPVLNVAKLKKFGIKNKGAAALFDSLRDKPNLQILDFSNNPFNDDCLGSFSAMLKGKRQLMGLYINNTALSTEAQQNLGQAIIQTGSSNLTHLWMDEKPPSAQSFCDHNKAEMHNIAERIGGLTAENPLAPQEIWQYEARKIAAQHQRREIDHGKYDRFIDSLPHPPNPVKLDYLFAGNVKGYTALDNPRTWQENPDLLDRLAENGELTIEALNRRSPLGVSLLESAIGFANNAADVFRTVNRQGITLDASVFINKGEPTLLMETLVNRWECGALMQKGIWEGQNPSSLQAVIKSIPQEQLAMIPNRHAFMASLRAGKQTAMEV